MSTMKIAAVILFLSSFAGAQCKPLVPGPGSECAGPLLIDIAQNPTVQTATTMVDISLPPPTPAAKKYILSIVNRTLQESDNGGAYHTLVGPKGDTGVVGPQGATGATGAQGVPGVIVGNTISGSGTLTITCPPSHGSIPGGFTANCTFTNVKLKVAAIQ